MLLGALGGAELRSAWTPVWTPPRFAYDAAIVQTRRPGMSAYGPGLNGAVEKIDAGHVDDLSLVDIDAGAPR